MALRPAGNTAFRHASLAGAIPPSSAETCMQSRHRPNLHGTSPWRFAERLSSGDAAVNSRVSVRSTPTSPGR
jgi:hypothetical protein